MSFFTELILRRGLVALYSRTGLSAEDAKRVGNARKRRYLVRLAAATAISGVAAFVLALGTVLHRPQRLTEYSGVKLAEGMDEVRYLKGNPTSFESRDSPSSLIILKNKEIDNLKGSDKIEEFNTWEYCEEKVNGGAECNAPLTIFFDKKRLVSSISCYSERLSGCPKVFGISNGATEGDVYEKLGAPSKSRLYDIGREFDPPKADERQGILPVYKYIQYSNLGIYFRCEKGKVEAIFVAREMVDP